MKPVVNESGQKVLSHEFSSKVLSHEFRAHEVIADIIAAMRVQKPFKIKVPLSCLVEYAGVKVLAFAEPPLDPQKHLILGWDEKQEYQVNSLAVEQI